MNYFQMINKSQNKQSTRLIKSLGQLAQITTSLMADFTTIEYVIFLLPFDKSLCLL